MQKKLTKIAFRVDRIRFARMTYALAFMFDRNFSAVFAIFDLYMGFSASLQHKLGYSTQNHEYSTLSERTINVFSRNSLVSQTILLQILQNIPNNFGSWRLFRIRLRMSVTLGLEHTKQPKNAEEAHQDRFPC